MRVSKLLAVLVVLSLLLSPLASFPVQASDPNDPDGDDDNDSDGYDSNQDGEISDEEKYTNLEEYYNNTNPNDPDTDDGGAGMAGRSIMVSIPAMILMIPQIMMVIS